MQIEASHLSKRYGTHVALDDVSFRIPEGTGCVALLGGSGGGKSTLLRVIGSLLTPDAGDLSVDGKLIGKEPRSALHARRQNGFVFQGYNLFPHLTALENITLPLKAVHGWSEEQAKERADEVLRSFELGDHMAKLPFELSGGQQQRVALARAIAARPRLLLLDEPTSALDPIMTHEVLELVRKLVEGGQQVVLSTHEVAFARKVAGWVVFLHNGSVQESAAAGTFFTVPQSEAARSYLKALSEYQ